MNNLDERINWHSGMEVTPETFVVHDNISYVYRTMLRRILSTSVFGIIPGFDFDIKASVSNEKLIVSQIDCDVMLKTGTVVRLHNDGIMEYAIPETDAEQLYFIATQAEMQKAEWDETDMLVNFCHYSLGTLPKCLEGFPLLKIRRNDGQWAVDDGYIAPFAAIYDSDKLKEFLAEVKRLVKIIVGHQSIVKIKNSYVIDMLADRLDSVTDYDSSRDFGNLSQLIMNTVKRLIIGDVTTKDRLEFYDVEPFFTSLVKTLNEAVAKLDELAIVVPEPEPEPEPEHEPEEYFPII